MRTARFLCLLTLFALIAMMSVPASAGVSVGISVRIGPPPLPVYVQPVCPGPGYIWAPGYWAYGPDGYYWIPGTWVQPPVVGVLWTPGYWGWSNGYYVWHEGYWGPHVGFYGGINYGFGYTGVGFHGGYWRGREFFYNRAVTNVNIVNVRNVYHTTVINNVTRVSYNGGAGGIRARETIEERNAFHERHWEPTHEQFHHQDMARSDRSMLHSSNHGHPTVGASSRPGEFRVHDAPDHGNGNGHSANNGNYRTFSKGNDRNMSDHNVHVHNNSQTVHEDMRRHDTGSISNNNGHDHGGGNAQVRKVSSGQSSGHENKGHGHGDNGGDHGHNDKQDRR
jgi:WXXGXW repeat (2 copies)